MIFLEKVLDALFSARFLVYFTLFCVIVGILLAIFLWWIYYGDPIETNFEIPVFFKTVDNVRNLAQREIEILITRQNQAIVHLRFQQAMCSLAFIKCILSTFILFTRNFVSDYFVAAFLLVCAAFEFGIGAKESEESFATLELEKLEIFAELLEK